MLRPVDDRDLKCGRQAKVYSSLFRCDFITVTSHAAPTTKIVTANFPRRIFYLIINELWWARQRSNLIKSRRLKMLGIGPN